ncbi:glycosyl hydrolase family 28-related protein [Paenibacillus sp. GCM10027626]|uniref:glycosyl hydrolase family 28-related protein n=1 Tax=Paenibacillus sp. GCM10027626 TaxID=3273411 RepID=UPI00362E8851
MRKFTVRFMVLALAGILIGGSGASYGAEAQLSKVKTALSATLASNAAATAELVSEGFEAGNLQQSIFTLGAPYGSLTQSAGEVLTGNYSVKGSSAHAADQQWAEFLKIDAGKLKLTPGQEYTISFKYRIIEPAPANEFFYLYGKLAGSNEAVGFNFGNSGDLLWWTEQLNSDRLEITGEHDVKQARMSFKASGSGDYAWIFGIHNGGTIIVDDVLLEEGAFEPAVKLPESSETEGFESGGIEKTVWKLGAGGTVTKQAAERINGQYAVKGTASAKEEWREFLFNDPDKLKLAADTIYTVTFKYKVMQPAPGNQFFYVYASSAADGKSSGINFGSGNKVLWRSDNVAADNVQIIDRDGFKMARMTFRTGSAADTKLVWGIRKGGTIVIDDVSLVKGNVAITSAEQNRQGYINVVDFGAVPNDNMDDTEAFKRAIATGKSIYVPAGTYHVNETLQIQNQNLIGSGMFVSTIVSRAKNVKAPIIKAGRTTSISDLNLQFDSSLITDQEGEGERVAIYTGQQWSLQRGSTIRNVRIENVGTAIYCPDGQGAESFSVTYDTLEIENYSYRGFDFRSKLRTGNVYRNIYILSNRPNVDIPFALTGEESEAVIDQLNVEHSKVNTAIHLEGVYGLSASTIHIEGVTLRKPDTGYITFNNSAGSIGSLSVYFSPIEQQGVSIVRLGDSLYKSGIDSFQPENAGYLRIGTLNVKGLNDPNVQLHGAKSGGLNRPDAAGFVFFDRPANARGDFALQLDHYMWYTFQNDKDVYEQLPADPHNKIALQKLGVLPLSGPTAKRPTNRMIAYVTTYYDTDLMKLLIWDGTSWRTIQ